MRYYAQRKILWLAFIALLTIHVILHVVYWKSDLLTQIHDFNPSTNNLSIIVNNPSTVQSTANGPIYCYRLDQDERLPDINNIQVRKGKSIFFHETSCRSHRSGKIVILPRQACAVESAARINPNFDVYLTFSSPGTFRFEGTESDRILQRLLEYKNIKIMHLNYENYTRNTPVEDLYKKGVLENSRFALSHASDVLRYLSLYKYGGIYLDMDVVVIKSLENLKPNYAGIETDRNVAAGVLSFDYKGIGRKHAESCVMDLRNHFKKNRWAYNGPGVITRLLRKLCGVKLGKDMLNKNCENFTVYPNYMFYPIPYSNWKSYFNTKKVYKVYQMLKNSYVLHVWNKLSEQMKVPMGTKTPYTMFAKKFCPKTFEECDRYF